MKKLIIFLSIIGFLDSCANPNTNSNIQIISELQSTSNIVKTYEIKKHTNKNYITVYEYLIDSCIYIGNLESFSNNYLTHKGNCKHCQKK